MRLSVPRQALNVLFPLQKKRFENLSLQKRSSHLVISETAMRSFAREGRLCDHPYIMRPFSVFERIEILSFCINQLESNPFFHIYLLNERDDAELCSGNPVEVICYDGICVQLTPAITDYNFQNGHSEIFLDQQPILSLCMDFFLNDLVKNHTRPEQDTIMFFKQLIAELSK